MTKAMAGGRCEGQAEALKAARLRMRLTQQAVADKSCVSVKTVQRAEAGKEVSAKNLLSLFAALGLDAAEVPLPPRPGELPAPDAETTTDTPPAAGMPGRLWFPVACAATGLAFGDPKLVAAAVAFSAVVQGIVAISRRPGAKGWLEGWLKPRLTLPTIAAGTVAVGALVVYPQAWMLGRLVHHLSGALL